MKFIILSIIFVFSNIIYLKSQENNLYGEHKLFINKLAIYIDKDGSIYPDYFISDSLLKNSEGSLLNWYKKNTDSFIKISKKYNCNFVNFTKENFIILNDSIISNILNQINSLSKNTNSVTFLIHGFRKSFKKHNNIHYNESTTIKEFEYLENKINTTLNTNTTYIEIYWDGLYISISINNLFKILNLFKEAQINAINAGKTLRKIIPNINTDTLNIITYSLGAKVGIYTLFNNEENEQLFKTPNNKVVKICLIAPAIGGIESFKNYFKRTTNFNLEKNDNYKLLITYNENDFVLLKKDFKWKVFGPGAIRYGNTSLGCNFNQSALKLKSFFNTNFIKSYITIINMNNVGKCHLLKCYGDSENFKNIIDFLNN